MPALPGAAVWQTARGPLTLERPRIAGIVNVTPDSFWDGGRHASVAAAVAHAEQLLEEGADLLDLGGESTRPGASAISAAEERARVVPVVEALVARWPQLLISVDTVKSEVAEAALAAGAAIINDVSAFRLDARMAAVACAHGAGVILMHSRGGVGEMASYALAEYPQGVIAAVLDELGAAVAAARRQGVAEGAIVLDPGLGFAKRTEHSIALLAGLAHMHSLGLPLLIGPSRKRFIGDVSGGLPLEERLEGTIAACTAAVLAGARIVRVHDVAPVRRALAVADAIRAAGD